MWYKMKTKKEFLERFASHPELAKKVFRQMGVDWKEIIEYPEDFRDASSGVSGFVYYRDTVPFAKRNMVLITKALHDFEQEMGTPLKKPTDDETQYLNWLAWFALENTIDEVMGYKESGSSSLRNIGWQKNYWG